MPRLIVTNGYPCHRCGLEINERAEYIPETGDWYGACLCRRCHQETTATSKDSRRMRLARGLNPNRGKKVSVTIS